MIIRRCPHTVNQSGGALSLGRSGSTLIESMIAFSIFAASALAVYPILIFTKTINRGTDVRELCTQAVKTKLAQYTSGGKLEYLQDSAFGNLSSPLGSSSGKNGAFQYAKLRYNMLFRDGICDGHAVAAILRTSSFRTRSLGVRECLGSEAAASTTPFGDVCLNEATGAYDGPCSSRNADPVTVYQSPAAHLDQAYNDMFFAEKCSENESDIKVRAQLPNFKVYVKLERVTPWALTSRALAALQGPGKADFRYDPACPNSWSGPFAGRAADADVDADPKAEIYDFDSLGDSIRITVTGVIDLSASTVNAIKSIGGITTSDPSRLMCSVSTVLTQDEPPVRYALIGDGMYAMRAAGLSGFDPGSSIASSSQVKVMADSMKESILGADGFVVHPLNLSVFVLGGGRLSRYSQCGGIPLRCDLGSSDYGGATWTMLEDDGTLIDPGVAGSLLGVQSYALPDGNTYRHIFFDMRSGSTPKLYVGSQGVCSIVRPVGGTDPEAPLAVEGGGAELQPVSADTDSRVVAAFADYWSTEYCTGSVGSANPTGAVKSAIFDPAGTEGFVMGLGQAGLGLYRVKDWKRSNPVMRVQPSYRALSK